MKSIGIFGLSLLIFASCGMDQEQEGKDNLIDGGEIYDVRLSVALVDQDLQDRLNPESPAYFGDEYTQGIEVLQLYNGAKRPFPGDDYTTIQPPFRETTDGAIDQISLGYYFLSTAPWSSLADEDLLTYIYIRYPDGSEDEVKVQLYENESGSLLTIHKIWFNDELVYVLRRWDEIPAPNYYNPKYYPFLEPVLDDDGNQIGEHVQPMGGTAVIVVVK